jgi:hypothetical protein
LALGSCSHPDVAPLTPDRPLDTPAKDPTPVGPFADCTPSGWSDVVCKPGLRCGLVLVGDPPSQGSVAQCVPVADKPLGLDEACQFDQGGVTPVAGSSRHYDRCGPGLGCVTTESRGLRCRKLCALRQRSGCKSELCVLPTDVAGTGYCAAADGCKPVFPQTGCGKDLSGRLLACYVLGDDHGGGSFCLRPQPYGDSTGSIDSLCERSVHCQPGLACITPGKGRDAVCRPYCELPETPDGGTPPDLGPSGLLCSGGLGTCHPIAGAEQYGRCY